MAKSADAFRTISEVAEWLELPAHVLRFWESKFTQVKPVKRAGGRRYYRPADMELLGGIKKLLHDDGMTIKGVQKILREQGIKYVSSLSAPLDLDQEDSIEAAFASLPRDDADEAPARVLSFRRDDAVEADEDADEDTPDLAGLDASTPRDAGSDDEDQDEPTYAWARDDEAETAEEEEAGPADLAAPAAAAAPVAGTPASDTRVLEDFAAAAPAPEPQDKAADPDTGFEPEPDIPAEAEDAARAGFDTAADETAESPAEFGPEPEFETDHADDEVALPSAAELPAFLHRSVVARPEPEPEPEPELVSEPEAEPEPEPLRAARIDLPPDPEDDEIDAAPGPLSRLAARRGSPLPAAAQPEAAALRDTLAALAARLGTAPSGPRPE